MKLFFDELIGLNYQKLNILIVGNVYVLEINIVIFC
jgi:hypothetical protein